MIAPLWNKKTICYLTTVFLKTLMDELKFRETFTLNGEEINQYSGYPHTILNYIEAFTWHDNHHKAISGLFKQQGCNGITVPRFKKKVSNAECTRYLPQINSHSFKLLI